MQQVEAVGVIFQSLVGSFYGSREILSHHVDEHELAPVFGIGGVDVEAVAKLLGCALVVFASHHIFAI